MIVPINPAEPLTEEHYAALRLARPDVGELDVAFRLARDVETFRLLLRGCPVDRDSLDPAALARALERRHVTLGPLIAPGSVAA